MGFARAADGPVYITIHDTSRLGVKGHFLHPICRDERSDRHRCSNRRAHVQERFSLVSPTDHCSTSGLEPASSYIEGGLLCTCYSPFCPLMRTACKLKDLSCLIGRATHSQPMPTITRNSPEGIQEERCLRQTEMCGFKFAFVFELQRG
ncbi:hypothetical protein FIBSPDRAFT_330571 [Athelia psychrophila]|uniref:Uncharacterized protein n=1 Tax=Athelia psychrophila TaxID=1759441 RepID=A0A167WHU3_9AGAM|nr:hypothetical protein FIBSPDRAFT_330571 [Fibularhizoctonia sp. CBS 109695]